MLSTNQAAGVGSAVSLRRYPVKSMLGEELHRADLTERGLLGDRAYALLDRLDGKVATAKNPRKWPRLFDFHAALVVPPQPDGAPPAVRITLPDGRVVTSDQEDRDQLLSQALQREVTLAPADGGQQAAVGASSAAPRRATVEEYWPDMEGLHYRDTVTTFDLAAGTFFDGAPLHLLTTATIDRLRELYPQGRFEARRFRPNVVVATSDGLTGFVEDTWIGSMLAIGDQVRLRVMGSCPRCVMTTLPQGDLPTDPGILRTAAQHNRANVGVYATVLRGGTIHRGDAVRVE